MVGLLHRLVQKVRLLRPADVYNMGLVAYDYLLYICHNHDASLQRQRADGRFRLILAQLEVGQYALHDSDPMGECDCFVFLDLTVRRWKGEVGHSPVENQKSVQSPLPTYILSDWLVLEQDLHRMELAVCEPFHIRDLWHHQHDLYLGLRRASLPYSVVAVSWRLVHRPLHAPCRCHFLRHLVLINQV